MSATKFSFSMSFADIDKGIDSIKNRSQKIRDDIHRMNVSVLAQWVKSGDVRQPVAYATKIVNEMDYHSQAIADWFVFYAGFQWNAEEKKFEHTQTTLDMETFQKAKAESFEKLSPPKAVKPLNIMEKLDALISTAENRLKAPEEKRSEKDVVSSEDLDALRAARKAIAAHYD